MGKFIPNVCTASQGTIHRPSPAARLVCFNNPVRRFWLVSAMSAFVVTVVFRSVFLTNSLTGTFLWDSYATQRAAFCCAGLRNFLAL